MNDSLELIGMNWQQIFCRLTREERQEITRLVLQRIERPRRFRLRGLRPLHLLLPATLTQMGVFVWSMQSIELMFARLMAGYLVVSALAIVPSIFQRPQVAYGVK